MSKKKPKSLFTVRGKKHERHPQIIVQSDKTGFGSVSLTHSRKKGGKNTVLLPDNPDANDSRQSYFAKKSSGILSLILLKPIETTNCLMMI